MRIHLGHHFYGAGNLGDDFMLAGFLAALRTRAPLANFTCCVPFPLEPLRLRFPIVTWLPCDESTRARCIADCDVWLGLGGSPFQHALSRWFIDHLISEAGLCRAAGKPMFFLGIGVQTTTELGDRDVARVCAQASAIWTRDDASAERLSALSSRPAVDASRDLAHIFFKESPPPTATAGRLTLVANFDYHGWSGQTAFVRAARQFPRQISERVWLAQESRELPGAERALYDALGTEEQAAWRLAVPDLLPTPAPSLAETLNRWPSGEWLVTSRYHAALAGAWAGSKIAIIATNEKLRAAARELACPVLSPSADESTVIETLLAADVPPLSRSAATSVAADRAYGACDAFIRAARSAVAPGRGTP